MIASYGMVAKDTIHSNKDKLQIPEVLSKLTYKYIDKFI